MSKTGGFYRTCPNCGAHLDPNETCDCQDPISIAHEVLGAVSPSEHYDAQQNAFDELYTKPVAEQFQAMLLGSESAYEKNAHSREKSETLIVGFDSSNGEDLSALSVVRHVGSKMVHINTFYGEEAEWMYHRLTKCQNQKGDSDEKS